MKKTHYEKIVNSELNSLILKCQDVLDVFSNPVYSKLDFYQAAAKPMFNPWFSRGPDGGSPLRSLMFYAMFSKKIYYLAENFAKELEKVSITVKAKCLPDSEEIICIQLPEWSGYEAVYVGSVKNIGQDTVGHVFCRLEMQFARITSTADEWNRVLVHFHNEEQTIEEGLSAFSTLSIPEHLIKFVINAYLYIHSGQPDLRSYLPEPKPLSKKPKVLRRYERKIDKEGSYPVILVGFNFMKKTQVSAHFQGYWIGSGRTSLVLKWKEQYSKGDSISP